jgi:hypothetical protein
VKREWFSDFAFFAIAMLLVGPISRVFEGQAFTFTKVDLIAALLGGLLFALGRRLIHRRII